MKRHRIGIIGLGKMGLSFFEYMIENPRWEVASVYDTDPGKLEGIKSVYPEVKICSTSEEIFSDESIDVVGIFTYADARPDYLRKAIAAKKHIIAEKPLGTDIADERLLLEEIERSGLLVAVNLFNRSAWYHKEMQEYIGKGEIGKLAIMRISHQTAGDMPGEHKMYESEGSPFRTCGMHYIDVARWYADSEIARWDVQGIRMWDWKDPWWLHAHGSFKNGIVFDITQGFTYGQMSQTKSNNSGLELIGTLGVIRAQHDFKTVTIEYHGVNSTLKKTGPYNGKNIDVLCENFIKSLDTGKYTGFPTARDSVISSCLAQEMYEYAVNNAAPSVGTMEEMVRILEFKKSRG